MTLPTYTPATYVVQSSGIFRSPDGTKNYWFYAGDVISMALAIEMGLPGAGYATASPFTTDEEQRIVDLLAEQGGGGVPTLLPTFWSRDYTNRTAGGGVEAAYTIYPFTIVGGLIRVEEAGKQIIRIGTRLTTPNTGASMRYSVYDVNLGTDSSRGMPGALLGDAGTVAAATTGFKAIPNLGIPVEPGFVWVTVEPSHELTIAGFQSHVDHLGTSTTDGSLNSGMTYNVAEPMIAHPASMNGGDPAALAPLVYVQLDDA